jgi:Glycosyl hydrolases family 38 N-terminal domain
VLFTITASKAYARQSARHELCELQASLMTGDAGFDALFFARTDYQDMALRRDSQSSEVVWQPDAGSDGVFTGTFPHHYGPPPGGFNYEWGETYWAGEPIQVRCRRLCQVESALRLRRRPVSSRICSAFAPLAC